ncbi:hypothetical protein SCG7086_BN_00100 [Chlamydiales bacterium SCGC AG-110-P3]|nr:hypothetical protein SCG7086_BN_00100 [Chlamydiales bacterium SCGC AG-110-P3]
MYTTAGSLLSVRAVTQKYCFLNHTQKRLKLPGAWWLVETLDSMLALRCVRANQQWASYWDARWEEVASVQTA